MNLNNINLNMLNKSLDGLWLRQQITMDNISNYSTPGYKSKYVDFETQLKDKINSIKDNHNIKSSVVNEDIKSSSITVGENENLTLRLDGNNVDLEKENLELAKTQIQYMYTINEMNSYFRRLKSVIAEGKK